jgi:hypothetical protein
MLVAEASEQRLDGQVFWLTAPDGPRTAFPPRGSGTLHPGTWPITAAAPRRIRTVFPIIPRDPESGRGHLSSRDIETEPAGQGQEAGIQLVTEEPVRIRESHESARVVPELQPWQKS